MDLLTRSGPRLGATPGLRHGLLSMAAALLVTPGIMAGRATDCCPAGYFDAAFAGIAATGIDDAPDVAVKAAFLYNFAKFAEWPALLPGAAIAVCVVGDDAIAAALDGTVRGKHISGHKVDVVRPTDTAMWRSCHLLFITESEIQRSPSQLREIRALPVLTVSDSRGFSQAIGIIELYVERERMRFAINLDAVERSGVRLSSRLLELAKVIRSSHVQ